MSLEEFLEDPYGEETGGNFSGEFTTIAKCKVVTAFQGWNNGEPMLFPYDGGKNAAFAARQQCENYCGEKQYPQQGLLTIVYGDDVPTHPEGRFENDWKDFVPTYHSRERFLQADEIEGELPYDLVLAGLKENKEVFNADKWCLLAQVVDTVKEYKGKTTRSGYPIRVFVVKEIFADREAAYKAAGVELSAKEENELDSFFADNKNNDTKGLSAKAINPGGWTLSQLQNDLKAIKDLIADAKQGKNPDSKKYSDLEARLFACEHYSIEHSDLLLVEKLAAENEVAF